MRGMVSRVAATLLGALALLAPAAAQGAPNTYIEMPDGVRLAANVQVPPGEAPAGGWPTIFV